MIKKSLILLSILACVSGASVKREEYNPDSLLALANGNRDSSSATTNNNSPVYSPNSYPSYSASYGTPVQLSSANQNVVPNYGAQPDANANQAYDNVASATSNLQIAQQAQPNYPNSNQGNLYYYYYPVNDKSKEINYQASPSNQYTSSIVPQSGDDQSNQNNANLPNGQQVGSSSSHAGHDLSYGGAQDLAYTASALNENSNNAQSAGGYESTLSNLASSLGGQYGYGSNGAAFGSQFANQLSGLNNLNFGEAFGGSIPQPSSVPFDPAFAAMANQFGGFQPAGQTGTGSSSGGPLSQLYQQASQVYQGLINGAGSSQPAFAASQQHPSYEASTGTGSSFRSKYGLSTFIMPLMALGALSLLIPTFQSLSTVASRKKRSAEDNLNLQQAGLSGYLERIDRYYTLYKNSIERDECINRIICELGDAMSGVRGKDAFFDFVERMVPLSKGNSKVSIFKRSALSADNDKCKHFKCH